MSRDLPNVPPRGKSLACSQLRVEEALAPPTRGDLPTCRPTQPLHQLLPTRANLDPGARGGFPSGSLPRCAIASTPIALQRNERNARNDAPIRSKKSTYFLRGRPKSFFDFLRGVLPRVHRRVLAGAAVPGLGYAAPGGERAGIPLGLVPFPDARLYSPRLEKRSQALQACNLTRNIQADGAPMVHHPWGFTPPGVFFCTHRTPESCL